ncbi:MAG TPA: hypothetical protein VK559_12720 [Ferruginibacter sp.]|nr:hypothetical protein [Ferruginibacter sp.]
MKKYRIKKIFMVIVIACLAILVFGSLVMGLWNAILPAVLGVKAITFIQALGILLLSKILFGGGPRGGFGGRCGPGGMWKMKMREKFQNMTPEEREKIRAAWKSRCGHGRWHMDEDEKDVHVD